MSATVSSKQHMCQCKHCGKHMVTWQFNLQPVPIPPPCIHEWVGLSIWHSSTGEHGSRHCKICGQYQQW